MTMNIRDSVLAQVEEKIAAGESLSGAIQAEADAQAALQEATAAVARARTHALRTGWTEAELKKLGLVPNTTTARSRKARGSKAAAAPAVQNDDHS
ncbi:hypothetical protein ABC195_16460 [Microbacterium sp. 2P01SA-2]|uniref:hypothetical protein n=1 Tax=Microbacterium sp. 2P01SA-2 TaxID=3132290 RepID=UPI00399F1AB9